MAPLPGFASRLAANTGRLWRLPARRALERAGADAALWLPLEVGRIEELGQPAAPFGSRGPGWGLLDLLRCLETAAAGGVDGVLLVFPADAGLRWSHALALGRAVAAVRAAGVPVAAWCESPGAAQYLVAAAADRVWLPESGSLHLIGLRSEQFYWKDLLDKLEIEPEVLHVGRFKSAGEVATRGSMSPEQREQIEAWQADLFDALVDGIAAGRGLEPETVRDRIDRGPWPARAAVEAGLADGCRYRDELEAELEGLASGQPGRRGPRSRRVCWLDARAWFELVVCDPGWRSLGRELPSLAYLVADGGISRGRGSGGITREGLGALLEALREQRRIRGVVLRIDSPGGDALASDLLHRQLERLTREKPVVVSMGDVAASGGYYLAAGADRIFAEAGTITGSIGVVGAKLNLEGLYRRLGIAKESVERGARAGLQTEARGMTPDERDAMKGELEAIYRTFLDRVGSGRGLAEREVRRAAEGRIWSGRRALGLGLVDALGGPLEAIAHARRRAGIRAHERVPLELLPRPGLSRALRDALGLPF